MNFNPLQNFAQGQQYGQQQQDRQRAIAMEQQQVRQAEYMQSLKREAANAGAQSEAFKELIIQEPKYANELKKTFETDDFGLNAIIDDSATIKAQLIMDPTGQSTKQFLANRIQAIQNTPMSNGQQRKADHTMQVMSVLDNEGPEKLLSNINMMMDIPNQIKGGSKKTNFAPEISPIQTDPETGQKFIIRTDKNTQESTRVDVEGAMGESLPKEEQRLIRRELLKDAAAESKEAFSSLKLIKGSLGTMDEAIAALDKGASTGVMERMMPTFRESTLELENAANRMGLDVVSATTFGALSEGELKLAMDTALPTGLEPEALKGWLVDRKKAKQKLARELNKMAITLGKGKTTIAEYLESNAEFNAAQAELSDDDLLKKYGG